MEKTTLGDKSIIITGGTTGIGRATAILLASKGAKLLVFGRDQKELNHALTDIRRVGNVAGLTADTTKKEDILRVFQIADKEFGGIDVLIDNPALEDEATADMALKDQEYIVKTNLLGYMMVAHEAVARMRKNIGHIVIVGSTSSITNELGSSVYVSTKAGVEGFSAALRKEVKELGIKVTLINPVEGETEINELPPEMQQQKKAQLKRLKAEDIANAVHYVLTRPERMHVVEMHIQPHL